MLSSFCFVLKNLLLYTILTEILLTGCKIRPSPQKPWCEEHAVGLNNAGSLIVPGKGATESKRKQEESAKGASPKRKRTSADAVLDIRKAEQDGEGASSDNTGNASEIWESSPGLYQQDMDDDDGMNSKGGDVGPDFKEDDNDCPDSEEGGEDDPSQEDSDDDLDSVLQDLFS